MQERIIIRWILPVMIYSPANFSKSVNQMTQPQGQASQLSSRYGIHLCNLSLFGQLYPSWEEKLERSITKVAGAIQHSLYSDDLNRATNCNLDRRIGDAISRRCSCNDEEECAPHNECIKAMQQYLRSVLRKTILYLMFVHLYKYEP